MKAKFYTLIAEQNAYMDSFLKVSDSKVVEFYKTNLKGDSVDEVERIITRYDKEFNPNIYK